MAIDKTLGASSAASGGFLRTAFDPDKWLESTLRSLKNYIQRSSSEVYDIRLEYPAADQQADFPNLDRTVIHLEIDDIDNPIFGLGGSYVDEIFDDSAETVQLVEAQGHVINFDVGIWSSMQAGGTTARMRAYQLLNDLFNGSLAFKQVQEELGIEIMGFRGGSFIQDKISDLPVFRALDIELIVRVYGRRLDAPRTYISEIDQQPSLAV